MSEESRKKKSYGDHCYVYGCTNNCAKNNVIKNQTCETHKVQKRSCGCDVLSFYQFPIDKILRDIWIYNIRRLDPDGPSKHAVVCSAHFDGEKGPDSVPTINLGHNYPPKRPRKAPAKRDAPRSEAIDRKRGRRLSHDPIPSTSTACDDTAQESVATISPDVLEVSTSTRTSARSASTQTAQPSYVDASTQWEDHPRLNADLEHSYHVASPYTLPLPNKPRICYENLASTEISFCAGISIEAFNALSEEVDDARKAGNFQNFKLNPKDILLMTLLRLRFGLLLQFLSLLFRCSLGTTRGIFSTTIKILSELANKYYVVWMPRERIRATTPSQFIENGFEGITAILDCTEVFFEKAKRVRARAQTFSNYKSHNTIKFMIAIAPSGYIMYVSPAFGGRASDKFIFRESGLSRFLLPGDELMVDRGFPTDLSELSVMGVKVHIPHFTRGRQQLTEREVTGSRRLSSLRVHVERAIRRMKTYRILKTVLNIKMRDSIDDIISVCAFLCNLKPPLIQDKS